MVGKGYWKRTRGIYRPNLRCGDHTTDQYSRTLGRNFDGLCMYCNSHVLLGVSKELVPYSNFAHFAPRDFGFTYASGQVVWRFPVSFQIVWSLLVMVLIWPNAGRYSLCEIIYPGNHR